MTEAHSAFERRVRNLLNGRGEEKINIRVATVARDRKFLITEGQDHEKLIAVIGLAVSVGSLATLPAVSYAQIGIGISVAIAPPPIPIYVQPPIPAPDYLWTPGYWAWNGDDYYFVPGSWVEAPQPGYLWTPGYWGYGDGGGYFFHEGYWGPHIGFYGGINYGFGYVGVGYRGGYWRDGHFSYNQSVNNINVNIVHNTYNERIEAPSGPRVGFNGGQGGVQAQPSAAERQAQAFPHTPPTAAQAQQVQAARADRNQFASVNHGAPPVAGTSRPGQFTGAGVSRATAPGGPVAREAARPGAARPPQSAVENANRATERTAAPRPEGQVPSANRPAAVERPATPAARPATPAARPAPRPAAPAAVARPAPAPVARPAPAPAPHEAQAPRPQPAAHSEAAPRGNPGGAHEEHH